MKTQIVEFYQSRRREIWWLAIMVLLAFGLRFGLAAFGMGDAPARFSRLDTFGYLEPARAIVAEGAFNTGPGSGVPMTDRPPLYPLLLASLIFLFGECYPVIIAALCLIGALTVIPIYLTSRLFTTHWGAMIAAGLYAFNITAIANAPMLLTDMFYAFLVAWQLYFFALFYVKKRPCWCYAAIAVAAISVLARPIAQAWIYPAIFLIAIMPGLNVRRKLITALVSLVIFFAIIFPWMYRNSMAGAGLCIDTNTGAMYHQNGAMLLAKVNGTSYENEKQKILAQQEIEFSDHVKYPDEDSRVRYRMEKFRELVTTYPTVYFAMHFSPYVLLPDAPTFCEVLGISSPDRGTLDVLKTRGLFAAVNHYFDGKWWIIILLLPLLAVSLVCYGGALWQLILWIKAKNTFMFFFFLAFVEYFFFLPGPITVPRYQLPALPLLAVMCGMAAVSCISGWRRRCLQNSPIGNRPASVEYLRHK